MRTISEASPPFQPSGPSRKLMVLVGGILGFALGVGVALALALSRLVRMKLAEAAAGPASTAGTTSSFERPVWTALPPPLPRSAAASTQPEDEATGETAEDEERTDDAGQRVAKDAKATTPTQPPSAAIGPSVEASAEAAPGKAVDAGDEREGAADQSEPRGSPEADAAQETPASEAPQPHADADRDAGTDVQPQAEAEVEAQSEPDVSPASNAAAIRPASSEPPGEDLERRERLRQRIRDIGARRRLGAPALDDAHVSQAIRRLTRSDRPTLAEIRRRRRGDTDAS